MGSWVYVAKPEFQSTPPARGATPAGRCCKDGTGNFNPRPPRGGRLPDSGSTPEVAVFQSTPPARGATLIVWLIVSVRIFQSTPPARGATRWHQGSAPPESYFNPRPPRGGRLITDLL